MRGKLLFVAGAAVGYVLGARAGRKRYEQIKAAAARVWETPGIQNQVNAVEDYAAEKFGELPGALFAGAKKVATQVVSRAQASQRQSVSFSTPVRQTTSAPAPSVPPSARTSTSSVTIAAPPDDETTTAPTTPPRAAAGRASTASTKAAKPPKSAKRTAPTSDEIDEADDAGA